MPTQQKNLCQWFTPRWAAEELVNEFMSLKVGDRVLEPSCGTGSFLQAIPDHIPAMGVELDPVLAVQAEAQTGRRVVQGDFRTAALTFKPTVIVGNPPFDLRVFDGFLLRAAELLPADGRCGFLLPAYALQTPGRVLRWNAVWGLAQTLVPRVLFPRLRLPLVFVTFLRAQAGRLDGFSLYREAVSVGGVKTWCRDILTNGGQRRSSWRELVREALLRLGGKGTLQQLYKLIDRVRPVTNSFWQAKVRQVLQRHFTVVARGVWAI